MEINPEADLDTSQVTDVRGSGGGGVGGRVAVGGGGVSIVGLLIYFLLSQLGGGGGGGLGDLANLPGVGIGGGPSSSQAGDSGQQQRDQDLQRRCGVGSSAQTGRDCETVALVNSIQAYWRDTLARSGTPYRMTNTYIFDRPRQTGCGQATADVGPFYCPADEGVYIELGFYRELEERFGARGGPFSRAYVLAHEYGHHVQNVLGTSSRVRRGTGATSDSVRLELQADCYAGAWANHASRTTTASGRPLISGITRDDIEAGLDTAARIGDDFIQSNLGGGSVDESQFSHGSSAQRQKWFTKGLSGGNPADCDTFARSVDLG